MAYLCLGAGEPARLDPGPGYAVWYDESHAHMVVRRGGSFATHSCQEGNTMTSAPVYTRNPGGPVLDAKFSLNRRFLAVQRSDTVGSASRASCHAPAPAAPRP